MENVRVPRRGRGAPRRRVARLIADRAYDSRKLRDALARRGTDLICPHIRTRKHKVQDRRKLRRYRKRWKIERTFSWLQSWRRIWTRHEHDLIVYQAFVHVALIMICQRRL